MHAATGSVEGNMLAVDVGSAEPYKGCAYLDVFERAGAVAGVELAVAVHQLEEVDFLRRLVFELGHGLVEHRLDGVETVYINVVVVILGAVC
jgi:hypothetical protein